MTFDPSGGTGGHRGRPLPRDVAPPWWEDDRGWGDDDGWGEFPRRRRSRLVQWTGVVVAAALVLGSAGSLAGVLLGGHSAVVLPTSDAKVLPADAKDMVWIAFEIENRTDADVAPVCAVEVVYGGRVVALRDVQLRNLPVRVQVQHEVEVPVPSSLPPTAGARVACQT